MTTTRTLAMHHAHMASFAAARALCDFHHAKAAARNGLPKIARGLLHRALSARRSAHALAALQSRYDRGED